MREVILLHGAIALVDDEDFKKVMAYRWHEANRDKKRIYAINQQRKLMHIFVMGKAPYPYEWDHVDGNGLNNQRSNLRLVTHTQNMQNIRKLGYKGVSRHRGGWKAEITIQGLALFLGHFENRDEAALAYNKAAIKWFGKHASLNEVEF